MFGVGIWKPLDFSHNKMYFLKVDLSAINRRSERTDVQKNSLSR